MLKKLALVSSWLIVTPFVVIIFSTLATIDKNKIASLAVSNSSDQSLYVSAENNIDGQVLGTKIDDVRPYLVSKFLAGTPLEPHSEYMVEVADKYGIDYRLIPAIAMKESGGGAAIDPASHNAWGWENGRTYFPSWEYAINTVGKTLKERYIAIGLVTPEQIMAKYAPPQLETGGKWAKDVNLFFAKIEEL